MILFYLCQLLSMTQYILNYSPFLFLHKLLRWFNTGLHIRAANKRLANIFVSRLAPDLSCDDISRHIEGVLRIKPVVELVKATSSYSSFHLTCECQDPKAFLDERIWPEGSLVCWWRADKRNNPIITATTKLRSDNEILAATDAAL